MGAPEAVNTRGRGVMAITYPDGGPGERGRDGLGDVRAAKPWSVPSGPPHPTPRHLPRTFQKSQVPESCLPLPPPSLPGRVCGGAPVTSSRLGSGLRV